MNIRRGVITAWDSGSHTATVQISGSLAVYLTGVVTAKNILTGDMIVGRKVAVLFFDATNQTDAVIIAVYV